MNTKGILFEHYEYSRSKLKQQDKLEEEEIEKTVEQPQYQATGMQLSINFVYNI